MLKGKKVDFWESLRCKTGLMNQFLEFIASDFENPENTELSSLTIVYSKVIGFVSVEKLAI